MTGLNTRNSGFSDVMSTALALPTEPIAVKLIGSGGEVPDNALYPPKDFGKHLALCQAFALVRRERKTLYCDKASEWCFAPLVMLGFCDLSEGGEAFEIISSVGGKRPNAASRKFFAELPRLPLGKYSGVLLAPLCDCGFEPDVTLVYCGNNSQLRGAVLAVKSATGKLLETRLDAIDSCAYACAGAINSGEYRVTIPDIGEHERAFAEEGEVILSIPGGKLGEFSDALLSLHNSGMGYANWKRSMYYDFQRPPFYEQVFRLWGLE